MEYYSLKFLIWAVALGALSAVSLPLGSVIGLKSNPRPIFYINSGRIWCRRINCRPDNRTRCANC